MNLPKRIVAHNSRILTTIEHHLSNGLIEPINTNIRLTTRQNFGFSSPSALLGLAGHWPDLPGRN